MVSRNSEKLENNKGRLRLIDGVLPSEIEKKNGHIVIAASIDWREPYKEGAVYWASKAALMPFPHGLREELSPEYNIRSDLYWSPYGDSGLRNDITDEELLR